MGKEWYWGGKSSKRSGHHHHHSRHVDRSDTANSSSSSSSSAAASASCMCAVFQLFDFHHFHFTSFQPYSSRLKPTLSTNSTTTTSTTTFQQLPGEEEEANIPKGVEAPRNSLKSEEGNTSLSSIIQEEDDDQECLNLNIPIGIHIKTSGSSASRSDTSSNSPGTKTPSLVARLMGLDLLPENDLSSPTNFTSPSYKTIHTTQKQYHNSLSSRSQITQPLRNKARHLLDGNIMTSGTRSLPVTPRISSARRSDVDHHHRLSLQINKENVADQDVDLSKLSALRRNNNTKSLRVVEEHAYESSRSPGHYARQMVKQVKESVRRRVGSDITNTITRDRSDNHLEIVNQLKSKRVSKGLSKLEEQGSQSSGTTTSTTSSSSFSCSPRLMRFTESKTSTVPRTNNITTPTLSISPKDHQTIQVSMAAKANPKSSHAVQPLKEQQKQQQQQKKSRESHVKSGGGGGGRESGGGGSMFGRRIQKMQEETFVRRPSKAATCRTNIPDKKCKKTPLSNNLLNLNVVPSTLLPVKKSPSNSPPSTNKHVFSHKVQPAAAAEVPDDAQEPKRLSQTLSSSQSQKYHDPKLEPTSHSHVLPALDNITNDVVVRFPNSTTTTAAAATARGGSASESEQQQLLRHYITKILARTGIANTSLVSFTNWFSPSHPLDPSIFYCLEPSTSYNNNNNNNIINLSEQGDFHLRCNRRLLFDVVDEILVYILRPYINLKPWININYTRNYNHHIIKNNICMQGSELIDTLCIRIESFPCRDCQVLEDIDSLIDTDLSPNMIRIQKEMAFEEEGEGLVAEIERDIVDTLVHETALILVTLERRRFGVKLFDCLTVD